MPVPKNIFHSAEIAGHQYYLFIGVKGPHLANEKSHGVVLGYCTSIVQMGKKKWAVALNGNQPQINLTGMTEKEVRSFAGEFGIPVVENPTAVAAIEAFRQSVAFIRLVEWAQKHPHIFERMCDKQDYIPWAEMVTENLSGGAIPTTGIPFLTSISSLEKQQVFNQNLFALMESHLVDQEKNVVAIRNAAVLAREQLNLLIERSLLLSKIFTRYATHEVTCSHPKGPCDCGYETAAEMVVGILDEWDPKDSSGAEFRLEYRQPK